MTIYTIVFIILAAIQAYYSITAAEAGDILKASYEAIWIIIFLICANISIKLQDKSDD